ncbi:hypothetical protein GCM10022224_067210 [Nonomuraea antimicrobica]|uniref:Uncharacterized protein n=1 Tax=Nonomuraea antimicrobica TaxID=561173 RepID=A0ABP7CN76_9ACTN
MNKGINHDTGFPPGDRLTRKAFDVATWATCPATPTPRRIDGTAGVWRRARQQASAGRALG